jgi:phosphoglycerate dehydrogenase-like enzyme
VDVGFLGGAQIDRFGNINATVIGDYAHPKVRLPGSGGSQEIAAWARRCYIMTPHQKRRFPARVDFSTSTGFLDGRARRDALGLSGGGPQAVVTDLGILEPDESGELGSGSAASGCCRGAGPGQYRLAPARFTGAAPHSAAWRRGITYSAGRVGPGRNLPEMTLESKIEILSTLPFNEAQQARLQAVAQQIHLTVLPVRRPDEIPAEIWTRTEVLYTDRILPAPNLAASLRWIQFHFTGIDFASDSPLVRKPGIIATSLSGAAVPQMAEYILMMLLALGHRLPEVMTSQQRSEWARDRWEIFSPRELRGATVGLVGYGSINREVARMLQFFNVIVLAAKRDAMHPQDSGYSIPGLGDPEGTSFYRLYPYQAIKSMIKECDFVVVTLPLTPLTRGLIGAEELAVMKPGAYLIQAGRGGVVDQAALVEALQEKRIAGAALDTFSEEPLPPASPFWKMPNVLITPHIGGISPYYLQRAVDLFEANLRHYVNGEPLFNRFDPELGY